MLTIKLWIDIYMNIFNEPINYFLGVIGTILTII